MEQKGTDQWLLDLAEEEPEAAYLVGTVKRPDDAFVPEWASTYWDAWHVLRFDRQYFAFGGESQIPFIAIDAYATRYGIVGDQFDTLRWLIGAMDGEWLEHVARVAEKQAEDRKNAEKQ